MHVYIDVSMYIYIYMCKVTQDAYPKEEFLETAHGDCSGHHSARILLIGVSLSCRSTFGLSGVMGRHLMLASLVPFFDADTWLFLEMWAPFLRRPYNWSLSILGSIVDPSFLETPICVCTHLYLIILALALAKLISASGKTE